MILLFASLLAWNTSISKEKKVKFGRVSMEEMQMTVYPADTGAPAVILFEGGYYDPKMSTFTLMRRVKILTKEGFFMADNEWETSAKGNIRGITYNLVDGEIQESKLEKSAIYEEKVWDFEYEYNFAMPDVKVGSVIDVEVRYNGFPTRWYFQHMVPVVKSDLEIGRSDYVTFKAQPGGIIRPVEVGFNHWAAEDVPAFISEPYLSSPKNYLARVELDISQINFPNHYPMDFASSWGAVEDFLMRDENFGEGLKWPSTFLNKYAKDIETTATTESEKAKLAVESVKSFTKWNEKNRLYMSKANLLEVTKEETQNSADINLMLIKLLEKLDFEVYPVVLSTRNNGLLHPFYPSLFKLNYVMAYVKIDGQFVLLDATNHHIAYNMLPIHCLNYTGRLLNGKGTESVSINAPQKYSQRIFHDLRLSDDMSITGKASYMNNDYAAYEWRSDYSDYLNDQQYVDNLMDTHPGIVITDFVIENKDVLDKGVVEKYDLEIEDAVTVMDNQAYLNMFLMEQLKENEFKSEDRKYPIDFIFKRATTGVIRLTLPENVTVAELPQPVNVVLPDNGGKFTMMYQAANGVITLNYNISINKAVFGENEYAYLKEFFGLVVSSENKPVVLNLN